VMFEEEMDRERFYGMPSAGALGVLVQILMSKGTTSITHDLLDHFSDGIYDLVQIIDELQLLGHLDVTAVQLDGFDTSRLEITLPGQDYLSGFAWELIDKYQGYFSD
jgi:hypothetical protein